MTRTPGLRAWAAMGVLTLAVTLLAIDSTVLALAIPSLSADLSPTASQLLWIVPITYAVKFFAHDGLTVIAVAALAGGLAAGWLFIRRQRTLATPLIDVELFRRPAFTWAIAATVLAIFALAGLLYFFSQYLQLVRGYSTLRAGLTELPSSLASLVVAVVTAVVRRLGNGRALGSGLLMAAVGLIVVALGESYGGIVVICVGLLIIGAGIGLAFTVSTGAVLGAVPADRAGAASAISETGLELGVALGIAMLGTIQDVGYRLLLGRVPSGLPGRVAEAAEQSLATLAGAIDPGDPGQAELMVQAREAFTRAMQATAIIAAVILLGAGVMAARHVPATSETSEETS
nr:MFS transporter [Actinomyces oris]